MWHGLHLEDMIANSLLIIKTNLHENNNDQSNENGKIIIIVYSLKRNINS